MDIAKLIGLLGLAILASCASTGPAERSYARIQQAEKLWGPAANWTPRQREVFNGLEGVARTEEAQKSAQSAAAWTAFGQGLQQAGAQIAGAQTDPFILYKLNHPQPALPSPQLAPISGSSAVAVPRQFVPTSASRYDPNSLANPYGAGSPYKPNGIMNPYSQYGSPYSNKSWRNPYATDAPKLYDQQGNYRGKLSTNPYDPDSVSNPHGKYGNKYSPDSINNPYGAGNPYSSQPINVVPSR